MLFLGILSLKAVILDITAFLIVIIGENKPMHKKYNLKNRYCWELQYTNSVSKTSCADHPAAVVFGCVIFDLASRCKHCSTVTDSGIGLDDFNFRGCVSCKMSGSKAKRSISWHTGWLGERDANGDLVGDWAQYSDNEQFKCRYCNVERKYSNGGRSSLIQHSECGKHRNIANGKKGRVTGQPRFGVGFLMAFLFWLFH